MKFKSLILISLTVLILAACTLNKNLNLIPADTKWEIAENYYNKGKYLKAAPYYEQLVLERNSIYTAEAQYKLADSYFLAGKYLDAVAEFQLLISLFPDYKQNSTAQYKIGVAYYYYSPNPHYTQIETVKAIDAFHLFLDKYPRDENREDAYKYLEKCQKKLIEKAYLAGYIYYKIDDYSSALMYFDEVIELGNHDKLELNSLFYSAKIHYYRQDIDKLYQTQEILREYFPDSKELKKIIKKTKILNKKMSKIKQKP
ncbi:MAG: outer membrane protein assembly factor BamD [Candidatus Cloacimonadales bacterium]|jgi:outer membrane assembly lipoprotein YfiO|nr:outer membrane protein assembly factor BamD [Candidatus Cloacimonadota bacterium]MDD3501377.1 outer membrane protein assembly factor BamD [Candidatus Cloacimonadota bacterium]MDX9976861.1 outer membrane protein assembly factor BamD [Candidatus Cloacimonadales bacterium]